MSKSALNPEEMNDIIEQIKKGSMICISGESDDCLGIDEKHLFVGKLCVSCFNHKTKNYWKNYWKDNKSTTKKKKSK
jgi:hypothetical protein